MNEIFGSHPYKPIYFTLYSYCRELDVTDIEQSWDYEQFIQFFVIMNEMVEKMAVNLNTSDKNENMNAQTGKLLSYLIIDFINSRKDY